MFALLLKRFELNSNVSVTQLEMERLGELAQDDSAWESCRLWYTPCFV